MPEQPTVPSDGRSSSRRRLIIGAIVAVTVLVVAGILAVVLFKAGGTPSGPPSSTDVSIVTTPSVSPTPSSSTPTPQPPGAEDRLLFQESLQSGNTAAIESRFADTVQVVIAASDCCGALSRLEAVGQLSSVQPGTTATWNFSLDDATLGTYRDGFYGQYFPVDALVGLSSDGFVASFVPGSDGGIVTLFMAVTASL